MPDDVALDQKALSCPFCAGHTLVPCFTLPDVSGKPARVYQCLECLCHIPSTAFAPEEEPDVTATQVAFHDLIWGESTPEAMEQLRIDLNRMVSILEPQLGPNGPGRQVCEIGCGRGGLLRSLIDRGYDAYGCEPSHTLVSIARKYYELAPDRLFEVPGSDFLDGLEARGIRPQAFIMWHVAEHVRNPIGLLQRLARMLHPEEGRLVLQVPMISTPQLIPHHYFFVTPETLPFLSKKLGDLPFKYAIDTEYKFITIMMGRPYAADAMNVATGEGDPWHATVARSEPIRTRDLAIEIKTKIAEFQVKQVEGLQAEKAALIARIAELESSNRSAIDSSARGGQEMVDALRAAREQVAQRDASLAALQGQMAQNVTKAGLLAQEIQQLRTKVQASDGEMARQRGVIEEGWKTSQAMNAQLLQSRVRAETAEAEVARQRGQLEAAQANAQVQSNEIVDLRVRLEAAEAEVVRQRGVIEDGWKSVVSTAREVALRDRWLYEHQVQKADLEQKLAAAQQASAQLEAEVAAARQVSARLEGEIAAVRQEATQLESELAAAQRASESAHREADQFRIEATNAQHALVQAGSGKFVRALSRMGMIQIPHVEPRAGDTPPALTAQPPRI